jgi:phosphatidylserine decarboxylase
MRLPDNAKQEAMSVLDFMQSALVPVHREGWRFIVAGAVVALFFFWLDIETLGWLGVAATAWCAYFFRDPERVTPLREGLVVAPADGEVCAVDEVTPPPELDLPRRPATRVSIFMSVFDVHVNRAPADATVRRVAHIPGAFLNASLDKASADNERQALTLEMADGRAIGVVQIAGLLARRIVSFTAENDRLAAGQRFGMIRFGSRVDLYLPEGCHALVAKGQRAVAGETVIADLKSAEGERAARRS